MTGVGVAAAQTDLGDLQVEVRSVNGRGLGVKCRAPHDLGGIEAEIERRCRAVLTRGNVTVVVTRRGVAGAAIDPKAAAAAVQVLEGLVQSHGLQGGVTLADLLAVPGVTASAAADAREFPPALGELVDRALDELVAARQREGAATAQAMLGDIDAMAEDLDEARRLAQRCAGEYRERLLQRVGEFLDEKGVQLEAADVVREVALFADRVDVSEELQRLGEHLRVLRERIAAGGVIGRRVEFLLQEALRETNTLGSKSPDVALTHRVVELKSAIDRLKEQAANLE